MLYGYNPAFNHSCLIAISRDIRGIQIWNTESWTLVKALQEEFAYSLDAESKVYSFAQEPNNLFASVCKKGIVQVWNTDTWTLVKKLQAHKRLVNSVAFSQTSLLATGSRDNTVRLWNTNTWELIQQIEIIGIISIAFNDNNLLAIGCKARMVRIWNTETKNFIQMQQQRVDHKNSYAGTNVYTVAFSSNNLLASCAGRIDVWKAETGLLNE